MQKFYDAPITPKCLQESVIVTWMLVAVDASSCSRMLSPLCRLHGPLVKCGSADLHIFKRVKCRWFLGFFCGRDGLNADADATL